ncbi:ribonuclease P protein component [Occultella glacieicola]|uniref:Ribonuclease P protein component n=1 Tax=Occultella glacieicola TaxID=2518684 RepID=A0ABY2E8B6_9MICO|nr:ribonuclease P protein component [Occultella glacieicola]TDE98748.1 ribonuclease P protein component [Occultella glacieicola]
MLPAQHRMRHGDEFADAIRSGARSGTPRVVVHYRGSTRAEPARVGFVVSKAIGGAVQRNLVKRRLRAVTAARLEALPPGTSVVVRALPGAAIASYPELERDVVRCLDRSARAEVKR